MSPSRRSLLVAGLAAAATSLSSRSSLAVETLGLTLSEAQLNAGRRLLLHSPTVDLHAHPGRFFLEGAPDPGPLMAGLPPPFTAKAIADMRQGHVTAALFNAVSDMRLLGRNAAGGAFAAREFSPGEAWGDYRRQIAILQRLVQNQPLLWGRKASDLDAAVVQNSVACIFAIEGGDFIEDRLDRLHIAYGDGVRAITIVHYHNNQIGDIQTQARASSGLSPLGRAIVREMNHAGIIIDLAHASPQVVKDTLSITTRPVMASHTNVTRPNFEHPRLITPQTAKLIAAGGGVIGSVPSGIGQNTFSDWIESILRLVDIVGADHVGIGTDMDANFMPVFTDYRLWFLIPAALLAHGLGEVETAQVMGENFQRLFNQVAV